MDPRSPSEGSARTSFPLLDSEPPTRSRRQRLIIPAAAVVVAALVAGLLWLKPWSSQAQPAAAQLPAGARAGRIVSLTASQDLVVSRTDGSHLVRLPALDQVGQNVTAALDNRYISLGDGQIVTTEGRKPAMARTKIYPFVSNMQGVFGTEPFSDHDQDLLALVSSNDVYTKNTVSEISLATGKSAALGVADQVAGDWQSAGAFVSVGVPVSPIAAMQAKALPDASVQLRTTGRPPVLLGTAATFARELGLPRKTPLQLTPYPNPSGSMVAVMADPITGRGGLVILSRTGRLITTVSRSVDFTSGLSWSPSGTTFAFSEKDARGQDGLGMWSAGGRVTTRMFPQGADYGDVIWSRDGKWVLSAASLSKNPNAALTHWVIMPAAGGQMVSLTGPGTPISWIG